MTSRPVDAGANTLPAAPATFYWSPEAWGSALRCRPLESTARHLFTTRQLQLTDAGDVLRLARSLEVERVVLLTQVHKADVVVIRRDDQIEDVRHEADILVSNHPGVAVAVRAADCVPVLLADRASGAVAAVHAGWRGTAAGAARVAVEALEREFGARPRDLVVAIGPSIGSCCYEVGTELVDAFAAAGHERYLIQRWFLAPPPPRGSRQSATLRLDLAGANRDQLVLAGVEEENVYLSGFCTVMNLSVFPSFRAEQQQAGRIAGAIVASNL